MLTIILLLPDNLSRISQIQQTYFLSEQIGKDFNGIIYNGYERPKSYYGYYGVYGDYRYQYYADRYLYSYKYKEKMIKQLSALFIIISLSSCSSISPGMHMETNDNWVNNESYVYIDSIDRSIKVEEIKSFISIKNYNYKIGKGDQVAITIWDCLIFSLYLILIRAKS